MKAHTPGFWLIVATVGLAVAMAGCSDSPAEKKRKFEEYMVLAKNGHPWAQDELGYCYAAGEGVEKNEGEALKWFRKASHVSGGHASTEALKFFRKAADGGNAEAQYEMGLACDDTLGSAFDRTEYIKWFRKAAENGNREAQLYLGKWFHDVGGGNSDNRDDVEAARWLRKAVEQGGGGREYLDDCDRKISETLFFRMRAEQGDAGSQNTVAWCYYRGVGAHRDRVEALAFWLVIGTDGKSGNSTLYSPSIMRARVCEEDMTPEAISHGHQRAIELQKEIEAKIEAKKAGK